MTRILKNIFNSDKFRGILRLNKVKNISLFGSNATGKARLDSGVDFLVDFERGTDLFDQIGLKGDLEKLLKKKVDAVTITVTPECLNRGSRERIAKNA